MKAIGWMLLLVAVASCGACLAFDGLRHAPWLELGLFAWCVGWTGFLLGARVILWLAATRKP